MIGETTVLITGKRGNGKSLKAVGLMKQEVAAGRAVFASNFNGLDIPGVQFLDDPREWETLPPGSILFVDEAQKFWRARRSGDPPPEVQAMETQRHMGITIVLLTQQPTYLDKHVRGLVDLHHHLMLEVGGKASRMWTWTRCMDDPEDATVRAEADQSVFWFDKRDFGSYRSAEVHTIKPKVPRKLIMAVLFGVVAVGLGYSAISGARFSFLGGKAPAEGAGVSAVGDTSAPPVPASERASVRTINGKRVFEYKTAEDYAEGMRPRIPAAPWTAPAFDGRQVVSDPRVFCMLAYPGPDASGRHTGQTCRCTTEQGTRYAMGQAECIAMARDGELYNPFRRERMEQPQTARQDPPQPSGTQPQPSATATGGSSDQFARYGGMRGMVGEPPPPSGIAF